MATRPSACSHPGSGRRSAWPRRPATCRSPVRCRWASRTASITATRPDLRRSGSSPRACAASPTRAVPSVCPSPAATCRCTTSHLRARSPRPRRSGWSACWRTSRRWSARRSWRTAMSSCSPARPGPASRAASTRALPERPWKTVCRRSTSGVRRPSRRSRARRWRAASSHPPRTCPVADSRSRWRSRQSGAASGRTCGSRSATRRRWRCSARVRPGSSSRRVHATHPHWCSSHDSTDCRPRRSGRSAAPGWSSAWSGQGPRAPPRSAAAMLPTSWTWPSRTCATPGITLLSASSAGNHEYDPADPDAHLIRSDGARPRCRHRALAHAQPRALARALGVALPCIRPRGDLLRRNGGAVLLMCGVFGAVLPAGEPTEAANVAALGLFALQHRGQESAGLAVSDGEQLMLYKDLGMISSVLDERRLPSLRGRLAIAHCRYSTTGSTVWDNAQPTCRLEPRRAVAIGHNGNLVNTRQLHDQLHGGRARLPASTATELLTALLADEPAADTVEALQRVLPRVHGAYTLVVLDERRVIGVRDPFGFRPLVLGP